MARVKLPLDIIDAIPAKILTLAPRDIRQVFSEPTLIRLAGQRGAPLVVTCLLHGNETSALQVLQRLKRWIDTHGLPRPMLIFVGNVHAAEAGLRQLAGQSDFNRIWSGGDTPEHELAERVMAEIRSVKPFAAIDIHNNTGSNPIYGCINRLEPEFVHLASLFSPTIVYFESPDTVISIALSKICPSLTIEAGKPGEAHGIERAFDLVVDALHLQKFRDHGTERDVAVHQTVGRMVIEQGTRFSFSSTSDATLALPPSMERWNFCPKPKGTIWAWINGTQISPLRVLGLGDADITDQYFHLDQGVLKLKRPITPSMITPDTQIIRSDCLGYLMEPVELPERDFPRRAPA
jgi:succinylglutamate desuccinylase